MDEYLRATIPYGIAYHNSGTLAKKERRKERRRQESGGKKLIMSIGLTGEEREIIEAGFQDHTICILVSTSTLSAGKTLIPIVLAPHLYPDSSLSPLYFISTKDFNSYLVGVNLPARRVVLRYIIFHPSPSHLSQFCITPPHSLTTSSNTHANIQGS